LRLSADETYPGLVLGDWDAEDRATMARHGLRTQAAPKDVTPGIQAVQERLRVAADGRPRLYVLRDALVRRDPARGKLPCGFIEEIESYVWERAADGRPAKEAPHKEDDHSMDAARYLVYSRVARRVMAAA